MPMVIIRNVFTRGIEIDSNGTQSLPVLQVQSQGMSDKVNGAGLQSKVLVDSLHRGDGHVHALVSRRVVLSVGLHELEELLGPALLEETHQGAANGLHLCGGDLGDLAVAVNIRTGDLLELEVARDVGVSQDLDQLTIGHHELGDQVDVVVAVLSKARSRCLAIAELFEKLKDIFKIEDEETKYN